MQVTEIEEGRYVIKAGQLGGKWVARAFPKPPAKSPGMVAEGSGTTEEAALAELREALQPPERRAHAESGFDVPTEGEYEQALRQVKFTKPQTTMLIAHANAGEDGLTAAEIAKAGGYTRQSTANSMYVRAGKLIGEYLDAAEPKKGAGGLDPWVSAIGFESSHRGDEGSWAIVMHEEMREAMALTLAS